jgi:hypothetical protein
MGNVTSARFVARERALVEWSQLRLFKAKERRGYLQRVSVYTNTRVPPLHTAYASRASARDHVTWNASARTVTGKRLKYYDFCI